MRGIARTGGGRAGRKKVEGARGGLCSGKNSREFDRGKKVNVSRIKERERERGGEGILKFKFNTKLNKETAAKRNKTPPLPAHISIFK